MLLTIAAILAILWLLGLGFHITVGFIHLLILIAVILVIVHLVQTRRNV